MLRLINEKSKCWFLLVPTFYLIDVFNLLVLSDQHESISIIPKIGILLVFVCLVFTKKLNLNLVSNKLVIIFIVSFIVNMVYWKSNAVSNLYFELKELFKLFYWVLLYLVLKVLVLKESDRYYIFKGFEFVVLVNTIFLIIGIVSNLSSFKSYGELRFGYDGLFYLANEATSFYTVAILYYFRKMQNTVIMDRLTLFSLVIISLFLGTKSIVVVVFIVLSYYMFKFYRQFILPSLFIITSLLGCFVYFVGFFDFFEKIVESNGLFYAISSGRTGFYATRFMEEVNEWGLLNLLFGGHFYLTRIMENDIIDIFLSLGIVGSVGYYLNSFLVVYNDDRDFAVFAWFVLVLVGAMAGHMFNSGVISIYLAVFSLYTNSLNMNSSPRLNITN